ncbi:MAG: transcription-repair coupling factor [Alphaproteobacteria bacterium]|nr:transcription-repair coupling factor [Alphaproteobacteria bacterium]
MAKFQLDNKHRILQNMPLCYTPMMLIDAVKKCHKVLFVCSNENHLNSIKEQILFFDNEIKVLDFPAWDTIPYDRLSPNLDIVAQRIKTLTLLKDKSIKDDIIVLTTVHAIMQKVQDDDNITSCFNIELNKTISLETLIEFLNNHGYKRTEQVFDVGDYAVRGSIVDIFSPNYENPVRIDFFGDDVDDIRSFDPLTQLTINKIQNISIYSMSEIVLTKDTINCFRKKHRELFGIVKNNELYEAVSQSACYTGMENWLPLFYSKLGTIFDYCKNFLIIKDFQLNEAIENFEAQVKEYYDARIEELKDQKKSSENVYYPVPIEEMFLSRTDLIEILSDKTVYELYPFHMSDDDINYQYDNISSNIDFLSARYKEKENYSSYLANYIKDEQQENKKIILSASSDLSRNRITTILGEQNLTIRYCSSWKEALQERIAIVPFVLSPLDKGFNTKDYLILTEQDIFGEKNVVSKTNKSKSKKLLMDLKELNIGDLVVHISHGIGKYLGLQSITVGNAPHDCLKIEYADNDKLYIPVENMDVISRYGSENTSVVLDRLGTKCWQNKKEKLKEKIKEMAAVLIKIAAQRFLKKAELLEVSKEAYDEFCQGFPYEETEDQEKAIQDVVDDLKSGNPMDRLICGDVGFGKTEVALRAAFVAALSGVQVAIIAPTTLLARQHYENFKKRMESFPIKVAQLSRLVKAKDATKIKEDLEKGLIDIVIGTHSILGTSLKFKRLGLVIVDEEQHFGVFHKEKLKQLTQNVHILTLTATPIPRTLQMSLTGIKDLSIIATPPVDRLAVRTFVSEYDSLLVREAIMREYLRGGQIFYICPRIADIQEIKSKLEILVPEIKIAVANGQMKPADLEQVMCDFSDKKYDLLLATGIVESGLDIPSVNTLFVHRSDMFGLAQLYQLRGRIGRSKLRGYCYFIIPSDKIITKTALKRLQVMQKLDAIGSGFSLASYDLDIRGAGNLLGEEQSGHIKEVGIELYQKMLEETVAELKKGNSEAVIDDMWSPQINVNMPVLIPETYISDLAIRMEIYKRLADLKNVQDIKEIESELIDRFGNIPLEVKNLFEIIDIKIMAKIANIEKIDANDKAIIITFHNNVFSKPLELIKLISKYNKFMKIRPDQKIICVGDLSDNLIRIKNVKKVIKLISSVL